MLDLIKIDRLSELLSRQKLDAVIVGPSNTLEYLTGFTPIGCERFQALFITREQQAFYFCNLIYAEDMRRWFSDGFPFYTWSDQEGFHTPLKKIAEDFNLFGKKMAVGESIRAVDLIDINSFLSCEFVNGTEFLEELRIIKSEKDIDKMRVAAGMADDVMKELMQFVRPGITEKDIKIRIEELFSAKGADGLSFSPIVACGRNSSMPHYRESSGIIASKDILLLDFGCRYKGFCSDISRTFFIGDISDEEKNIYTIIKDAQARAFHAARKGAPCCDVDKAARDHIERSGMGQYFLNRTGHGIGFDVHEAPYINGRNQRLLEPGMAFSIEPGISIPGKSGMRIEDIVVINHQGETEILNQFTREIVIIR